MSYSVCKIKNLTGESTLLNGHTFSVNEVYTIQDTVRLSWSQSDDVIQVVSGGDFEIHDSSGAISGASDQIDWLKDNIPIDAITSATSAYSMKSDAKYGQCAINTTTNLDLKLITFGSETYTYKYVWNGNLFGENIEHGDYARFFVCDVDNILGAGAGYEVKSFIEKAFIKPTPERNDFNSDAPAKIPVGLYLRCAYTAVNSGSAREVYINYDIHNKD